MEKLIFQFVTMFLFWWGNSRSKQSWLTPSSWLLGIYMLGSFFGIGVLLIEDYKSPFLMNFWNPLLVFLITLILYLLPFRLFNENRIQVLVFPRRKVLDIFANIIIALSFFAILFFSSTVVLIFSMGDLGALRNSRYGVGGEEFIEAGLLNTIASVAASLYVFAQLLFFVYACIGKSKQKCILLLISSISEPLHVLCYVGRDGIVFWIFSFVFLYLLFKPYLPPAYFKPLRRYFTIGAVILLLPFFSITSSRFEDSDKGVGGSVVDYLGQQFVNGPLYFSLENPPVKPWEWASFPLVRSILGIPEPQSTGMLTIGEWKSWGFSTFLSSFYGNFGFWGLYLVALLLFIYFYLSVGKCRSVMRMQNIIVYILFFQIFSQGFFYFRQYTRGGNLFILICLLMSFFVSLLGKTNKDVYLYRGH